MLAKLLRLGVMGAVFLIVSGCYHATIDTGRAMGNEVVDKPWAAGFVYGLVPPSTVEVAEVCTNGVAQVETQLSFLNGLVGFFTAYIFTPMHITVTCAEKMMGSNQVIEADEDVLEAIGHASDLAVATREPVFVKF